MSKISIDSSSVQSYLAFLQNVISRMASNSAGSKTWCVALVSAILVVIADKDIPSLVWVAIIPILLFMMLDTYYLSLEQGFRDRYNSFIKKLHYNEAEIDEIFLIAPSDASDLTFKSVLLAFGSFSIWPFYVVQILILIIVSINI